MISFQLIFSVAYAQTKDITGTVISSEKNEAVAGATVKVKGTTNNVLTDDNGVFSMTGVPDTAVLEITASEYQPAEVSVADKTTINITLQRATTAVAVLRNNLHRSKEFYRALLIK